MQSEALRVRFDGQLRGHTAATAAAWDLQMATLDSPERLHKTSAAAVLEGVVFLLTFDHKIKRTHTSSRPLDDRPPLNKTKAGKYNFQLLSEGPACQCVI